MRILDAILAQGWAIHEPALKTILEIAERAPVDVENLAAWKSGAPAGLEGEFAPEAVAARLGVQLENTRTVSVRDGVAILPVAGPIFRYANLFTAFSGASSISTLAADFTTALEDPMIAAILLSVDSPGGEVDGVAEFAGMVKAARGVKPVVAYVDGSAASAAYWIASAADEVVIASTGRVGSIGVVASIQDTRERDAKGGVKTYKFISSQSPNKQPDPSTDAGAGQIQALIDRLAVEFIAGVADNRGVSPQTVVSDFGAGAMFVGADAVDAGLADRVGTFEDVLAGLVAGRLAARRGGFPAADRGEGQLSQKERDSMTTKEKTAAVETGAETETATAAAVVPVVSAETIARDHPAIADHFRAEGAGAERERILGVEAQALPGHEALIERLKADGKTSPEAAAAMVLAAEKQTGARRLAAIADDADAAATDPVSPSVEASDGGALSAEAPLEDRLKAEWDRTASLRAEFGGDFDRYLAFSQAEAAGRVKILKK